MGGEIAVVGSTTIDQILLGQNRVAQLGGVTVYAGLTYHRLGIRPVIVSNFIPAGPEFPDPFTSRHMQVIGDTTATPTVFINDYRGHSLRQRLLAVTAPISDQGLQLLGPSVRWIHLGPLHPADIKLEAIQRFVTPAHRIILDIQGLVRQVTETRIEPAVAANLSSALHMAHTVKANQAEIETVLRTWKMDPGQLTQAFDIQELIVTQGAQGGIIHRCNDTSLRYHAPPVTEKSDPTGAGDVFLAAYVALRHFKHQPIPTAAAQAAHHASLHVAGKHINRKALLLKTDVSGHLAPFL